MLFSKRVSKMYVFSQCCFLKVSQAINFCIYFQKLVFFTELLFILYKRHKDLLKTFLTYHEEEWE